MSACGPLATNRIFMADGRFRCEADMARPAASSTQSLVTHKRHPRLWVAAAQNGPVAYSAGRIFLISLAA
jgi:hypothetical protein